MELRPIDSIIVEDRARKDFGDLGALAASIKRHGILQNLVVDEQGKLLAGERRLRAAKMVGLTEVPVKLITECDPLTRKLIELEENLRRKEMVDAEKADLIREIHKAHRAAEPSWSQDKTADSLGIDRTTVNVWLKVADAKDASPEVAEKLRKEGFTSAYKQYVHEKQTKVNAVLLQHLLKHQPAPVAGEAPTSMIDQASEMLLLGDCRELIKLVPDASVDLIYTDPPYGIDLAQVKTSGFTGDVYKDDSAEGYQALISQLAPEWVRVLKTDSWLVVWCDLRPAMSNWLVNQLESLGLVHQPPQFYWIKDGGNFQCNLPATRFASGVEQALVFTKGRPVRLRQGLANYGVFAPVPETARIHALDRSLSLTKHLISVFCHSGHVVLDTFAGGGSTLRACVELGITATGFELDENNRNRAVVALEATLLAANKGNAS